jgi:DNA-binding NarL/FixJ family response regulator
MIVYDNGLGIPGRTGCRQDGSLGMIGMSERARSVGGHASLQNAAGPRHAGVPVGALGALVSRRAATVTLRIMLVDDHPIVRRGVRDILVDAFPGATVEEVGSGADAVSLAGSHNWDVAILDLTLPDGSGLDVLKRLRQLQPRVPVLILSMHAPEHFARRAILAGASGYLTKDTADTELVTAVTQLLQGGRYFGADVMQGVVLSMHPDSPDRPHERLSDREYQVLRMIGRGKTVSEIASELTLSVKTVSTYRTRVLEKMGMRTNAELTRYAVQHGLE